MKKLLIVLVAFSFVSCGTSKTVRSSKKVIKGEWTLNKIDYSSVATFNIDLLSDASYECFKGSSWAFIPNNNTGTYSIKASNCNPGMRYFIFKIDEVNELTGLYDFLLKPTDKKGKSETNKGFRFKLTELSDSKMQWQETIYKEGKPFIINMNFIKNTQ